MTDPEKAKLALEVVCVFMTVWVVVGFYFYTKLERNYRWVREEWAVSKVRIKSLQEEVRCLKENLAYEKEKAALQISYERSKAQYLAAPSPPKDDDDQDDSDDPPQVH